MSITDEMRNWGCDIALVNNEPRLAKRVNELCDRIDAAHKREADEQYDGGYNKGCDDGFDEGFASADDWYTDHADELAEHDWVKLPRDADGVPIHVGDKLDGYNETTVVQGLTLDSDDWSMTCENGLWFNLAAFTHHKDTVEDVLREFGKAWVEWEDGSPNDPIAKYADRIREAVEHE